MVIYICVAGDSYSGKILFGVLGREVFVYLIFFLVVGIEAGTEPPLNLKVLKLTSQLDTLFYFQIS